MERLAFGYLFVILIEYSKFDVARPGNVCGNLQGARSRAYGSGPENRGLNSFRLLLPRETVGPQRRETEVAVTPDVVIAIGLPYPASRISALPSSPTKPGIRGSKERDPLVESWVF